MGGMAPELALCTTREIADRYGVDASTVRRWVTDAGLIPAVTTPGGHYRFDPSVVEQFLADQATARHTKAERVAS